MSFTEKLFLAFDVEVFQTEEIELAERKALETNGNLYCWKTSGESNWLEKGLSISDVYAVVVLPSELPEQIDMLDDHPDEDEGNTEVD